MPPGEAHSLMNHLRRVVRVADHEAMTDGQLLERFLAHQDDASFETILRRHGPMVLGVCRRMLRNESDAEDAFQATFLVLVRKARSIVPREKVGNWLYGVACHTARRARDANLRRYRNERQVEQMPQPEAQLREQPDWAEVLDRELELLPEKYRLPIVLCDLEGRSRPEIAGQLKIPEGTLSSRLARGRRLLARRLTGRGVSLSAAALPALINSESACAAVPSTLATTTLRAATGLAAGSEMLAISSKPVVALMEGVMKIMTIEKVKRSMLTVGTLLLVAVTLGVLWQSVNAGSPERWNEKEVVEVPSQEQPLVRRKESKLSKQMKLPGAVAELGPQFGTFCWCPPGKFKMGEKPDPHGNARQVDVTLPRGFWMGKYEVTQALYQLVMGKNPCKFKGASLPVETVNFAEAAEFCHKLTILGTKSGDLPMGWEFRLPTEAQWEYACRAGTTTMYSFGNDGNKLGDYAWFFDNSGTKEGFQRLSQMKPDARAKLGKLPFDKLQEVRGMQTHPVGRKKPNAWGLCDMHGNVSEWCRDWYQHKLPGGVDPEMTNKAEARVIRGGGWGTAKPTVRTAFRLWNGGRPEIRSPSLGFRAIAVPIMPRVKLINDRNELLRMKKYYPHGFNFVDAVRLDGKILWLSKVIQGNKVLSKKWELSTIAQFKHILSNEKISKQAAFEVHLPVVGAKLHAGVARAQRILEFLRKEGYENAGVVAN